ncbi:MAG TPA: hypothetical protein VFG03_09610 [Telluria sp.]|nr:hypothetical protein [Telluria sp.]
MKNPSLQSFANFLEEIAQAVVKTLRYGVRAIATMSWPALLMSCVGLALAITIVPLAIFLFVVFMAIKLVVAAIVLNTRRRHGE